MILKSARKSSDAHTWGFKNGVVMTTLSSGCRATARYFTVAGSFLFHGFSRPPFPPPIFMLRFSDPFRNAWQTNSYLITECMDGEAVSDLILNPHDL
jgi:hypothetical protein